MLLQQDNVPAHSSRLTKNKILQIQGLELIEHPDLTLQITIFLAFENFLPRSLPNGTELELKIWPKGGNNALIKMEFILNAEIVTLLVFFLILNKIAQNLLLTLVHLLFNFFLFLFRATLSMFNL